MMKSIFLILVLAFTTIGFAQTPEKMSYQAIVRNSDGDLVSNSSIGMQISIVQSSANGTPIYVETHLVTTNINGLVTIEIGMGTIINGSFSEINWGSDTYFIKTETDITGGVDYSISGTSQLLSVPYALHAKTADNVSNYKIGDFAHGGIVFWVDETGQHGLVCVKSNQSTSVKWGTFDNTQAKGNGIYAGKANNLIIVTTQVLVADSEDVNAARLCNELQITENNRTYGDWYLPSRLELNLMYQSISEINDTAVLNGGDHFISNVYWTSTEDTSHKAYVLDFSTGEESTVLKSSVNRVRAIRSF